MVLRAELLGIDSPFIFIRESIPGRVGWESIAGRNFIIHRDSILGLGWGAEVLIRSKEKKKGAATFNTQGYYDAAILPEEYEQSIRRVSE